MVRAPRGLRKQFKKLPVARLEAQLSRTNSVARIDLRDLYESQRSHTRLGTNILAKPSKVQGLDC